MAKVSVRALRRELKEVKSKADVLYQQCLDREQDYRNLRLSMEVRVQNQATDIARLRGDLRKEQQFSELVTGCLHGILAMTKSAAHPAYPQPVTGMISPNTERR